MTFGQKMSRPGKTVTAAIIIGTGLSVLITVLLIIAVSAVTISGSLDESRIEFITYLIVFVAVFVGSIISSAKAEGKVAIIHAAVAAIYVFILIAINIIFFDGNFVHLWTGLIVIAASTAVSLFAAARGTKQKKRYKSRFH